MLALDASSIVFAWDTYPINQFPPFWRWVAKQVHEKKFAVCTVALDEVKLVSKPCAEFLKDNEVHCLKTPSAVLQVAADIKKLLGIQKENYGSGVDENDLLIIAAAKVNHVPLVSDEEVQLNVPKSNRKLKIPAVCKLPEVSVQCMNWVTIVRDSGEVFE